MWTWTHRYEAYMRGTYENPVLIDDTPPASPIPTLPPLPRRLGSPLPIELVSMIINVLKHEQRSATLASLAQANSTYYKLVMTKLYETVIINATNAMELDFRHGASVPGSENTAHISELDYDREELDATALDIPIANSESRRNLAEGYCLRLVIDVAQNNIPDAFDWAFGRLYNRFTNVREVVFTSRAVWDIRPMGHYADNPLEVLSPPGVSTDNNRDDSTTPIGKTRRAVLYLPYRSADALEQLSHWSRRRPAIRRSIQFVIYGMDLRRPDFDLYCMDVECHFKCYGIPPGAFEHALAEWVYNLFSKGDTSTHPRLRLFDIPSLVFKDQDRPTNPAEANQAARDLIELLLTSKKRFGEQPKYLKDVMSKIDFYDSVYEDEEYPVVKPRPINELGAVVSG